MRTSSRARPSPGASRSAPGLRRPTWSSRWTSTGTGWWWECNDIRTAGTGPDLNPGMGNEQEAADTPGEASAGGAGPRHEGARLLRRVLQRHPAVLRWRSLVILVPHGGPGYRRHGARKTVPVRLAGRALSLARERSAAPAVRQSG